MKKRDPWLTMQLFEKQSEPIIDNFFNEKNFESQLSNS